MAPGNPKHPQAGKTYRKTALIVGMVIFVWIALLISPIGPYVAAVTIFGIILVLYIIGCIHVREDDFR